MNANQIEYNKMNYNSGPIKFTDFVSDKFNTIHEELYNCALQDYFATNYDKYSETCKNFDDFLSKYKLTEIKNKEYNLPSSVIISEKTFPFKQEKIDLTSYWNTYDFNSNNKDISNLISDEDTLNDAQVVYINYATGKCKFRSKFTGREFWTTLDYINSDTTYNEDEMTLKNTFGHLINKS